MVIVSYSLIWNGRESDIYNCKSTNLYSIKGTIAVDSYLVGNNDIVVVW